MIRILVLDMWHATKGGPSKSALYKELSKDHELKFIKVEIPVFARLMSYARTFHVNMYRWKQRKARFDETLLKRPSIFKLMTKAANKSIKDSGLEYDMILQIGSLFGPVENPLNRPYFTYSDSTVRNPDLMWKAWMPDDFNSFRNEWYALERKLFQTVTRALFYSHWAADTLVNEYSIDKDRACVVGSSMKMSQEVGIDWGKRPNVVLFVSTDFVRKGGNKLIAIFEEVVKQLPDATLNVVGNISNDLKKNQYPWLNIVGEVGPEQLAELYERAKVLLHPAEYDPFPSVILEAANFEVPTVASDICGIPEMIENGKTGFLVEKDNMKAFSAHLVNLLKDRQANQRLGESAKCFVREKFYPKNVAANMQQVFIEFIKEKR